MNATQTAELIKMMKTIKGQNVRVTWQRDCKTRKTCPDSISKTVSAICRCGIDYDNRAVVQGKRESGELPAVNAGLPWGEWAEFPFRIQHKGADYLRLYPASGPAIGGKTIVSEYFRNGQSVSFESVKADLLASELPKEESPDCFTIKAENLVAFAGIQA